MQVLTATKESGEDLSSLTKSSHRWPASALSPRSSQHPQASALIPSRGFPSWSRALRHTVNIPRQVFAHYNKNGYQFWTISQKSPELAICWAGNREIGEICLTLSLNVQMSNSPQPTHLAGHLLDCIGGKNAVDCSPLSPDWYHCPTPIVEDHLFPNLIQSENSLSQSQSLSKLFPRCSWQLYSQREICWKKTLPG